MRGAAKPEALAKAAAKRNVGALAMTEFGGLYSAVAHQRACDEEGIKPLFGCSLPARQSAGGEEKSLQRVILLARSNRGWSILSRLCSAFALEREYDLLHELDGETECYVLSADTEFLQAAQPRLPSGLLFAELIIHDSDKPARRLARWAQDRGIPVVASNDVHFVNPADQEIAAVLSAMRTLKTIGSMAPEDVPPAAAWLAPAEEMERRFRWIPQAIANAAAIADDCQCRLQLGVPRLPRYDRLAGNSSLAELRSRCLAGMQERYPHGPPSAALQRLSDELGVVSRMHFADYLLMVHDIACESFRRGIRTFGRGSAAASIICYLLKVCKTLYSVLRTFNQLF